MTSIEWLIEELTPSIALQQKYIDELKEKAKKMHKGEIIDGVNDVLAQQDSTYIGIPDLGEQYYIETFVNKESDTTSDFEKPFIDFAKQYFKPKK